jgi:hypothetical protein
VAQRRDIEEARFERIIEIGGVICDLVNAVDQLSFKRGTQIEKIFAQFGEIAGAIIARMLHDAFTNFKGQVETGKIQVSLFEMFDDAKGVQIVIEAAAMSAHQFIEFVFAGMTEWRMANVMHKRESFYKRGVQSQSIRYRARDLRHFDGMRQAIAEVIREAHGKNLGLGFQAAKSTRVHDAIAVADVIVAIRVRWLGVATTAGMLDVHGPGSATRRIVLSVHEWLRRVSVHVTNFKGSSEN